MASPKYFFLNLSMNYSSLKSAKIDFQSQFIMSEIIQIFLDFFFIEECQFRSTLFVIDIFW